MLGTTEHKRGELMKLIIRWLVSTVALMIVARFVNGFEVRDFKSALIAAAVIGLINATLGLVIKVLTFPLSFLTLGIFLILINAAMLKVAAYFVSGFQVRGWWPAILGAIVLSVVSSILHWIVGDKRRENE